METTAEQFTSGRDPGAHGSSEREAEAALSRLPLDWQQPRASILLAEATTISEGAGPFGIGILADTWGNDRYHGYQEIQGFGCTLGGGLLVDATGDDTYIAEDHDIRFPSARGKKHNSSLVQNCGFGKRADFGDGHSLAGGFGMLVDGSGDDTYHCGVFGQGTGYWHGSASWPPDPGTIPTRASGTRREARRTWRWEFSGTGRAMTPTTRP